MPANDEFAKNNLPLIGGVLAAVGTVVRVKPGVLTSCSKCVILL